MRGWLIVTLIVVFGWMLIVGPPAFLVPYVEPVSHYTNPVLLAFIGIYTAPGRWIMLRFWGGFFHLSWAQVFHGVGVFRITGEALSWLIAILISYVFWTFVGARFWKLIGRWNPFGWKTFRHRCQGRSESFPLRRRKRGPLLSFVGRFPLTLGAAGAEPCDAR